jgi:peptide chain release factor 1
MPSSAIERSSTVVGVEMREGRGRRGIGQVVGRHVDRLHRRDRTLLGGGDALLQRSHLGRERRLVADRARHATEQRRHLGACLGEAEDVVDEEQHVLALLVAEVLGHRDAGQPHAQTGAGGLVHLAEHHHRLRDDARLGHLAVEVVAFARALAYAGEHREAAVLGGDVADQLLDEHGLADAGATEESDLAAALVGREHVHDLDPGLEDLLLHLLLGERRRGPMDRKLLGRLDGTLAVDGLADQVEDAPQALFADRDGDGLAGIGGTHAAHQTVGRIHGDAADDVVAYVQRRLDRELDPALFVLDENGVVDPRQLLGIEFHVHRGTDHLDDFPDVHVWAPPR